MSDSHDTDLENHTQVSLTIRASTVYSHSNYGPYLEKYINKYIEEKNIYPTYFLTQNK